MVESRDGWGAGSGEIVASCQRPWDGHFRHLHRKSADHRSRVKRKMRAYHAFIQAAVDAQGLLQYLAVIAPKPVWDSFGSWLRTTRPGIPPSEFVSCAGGGSAHVGRLFHDILARRAKAFARAERDGSPDAGRGNHFGTAKRAPARREVTSPISTLREWRDWSILQHPIDVQVDALVVEAEQVFDLQALGNWRRITPHDVLDELVAHPSRPVARHSLIRAARDILGGLEQIHAYVQLRNVVAGRQSSLKEENGPASFPQCHAVNLHPHVP